MQRTTKACGGVAIGRSGSAMMGVYIINATKHYKQDNFDYHGYGYEVLVSRNRFADGCEVTFGTVKIITSQD